MEFDIASAPVYAEFNIGTLVYLAFALVAFIVNQINKSKKKQKQQRTGGFPEQSIGDTPPSNNKGKTFEELLEEFTGNAPKPQPERVPTPVTRETTPKPRRIPEPVNNPYQDALNKRMGEKPSETYNKKSGIERFDEFEDEEVVENDYAELLGDEDSARKAFVLSEIFQRKY